MQGDFSVLYFDSHEHERGVNPSERGVLRNINGVLHQQGRVITDADLTEGELLELAWNGQAGRDIIGSGICAVPAAAPQSFRVESAQVTSGGEVHITVRPGRAWADGILTRLAGATADPAAVVERRARYYGPPLTDPLPQPGSIGDDTRDAVILEVSEEALHGFQYPDRLIEPALGGPDTAERSYVNVRFRLLRLAEGEDCVSIIDRLKDDPSTKGRLSVSLAPVTVIAGDCPVVGGGGYLGFEHHLYRIEIADGEPSAPARFKWSQWNGGLVGRGRFDATLNPARVVIDAGRAAIIHSGLTEFYLEALQYDALDGTWNVVYGTTATLNTEHDLELAAPATFGAQPSTTDPVFFRLWNGVRDIADFTNAANPVELRDGIRLVFDAPGTGNYQPRDYWTFAVRAGEIPNPAVLIDQAPTTGIVYHRVPLAEIDWTARQNTTISGTIEDCRKRFRPLTKLETCCTYRVGDGTHSFGDFDSIQAAVNALPAAGGQVCVLPGEYTENVEITDRTHITLTGCGLRSRITGGPPTEEFADAAPVIHVRGGRNITIADLAIVAHDSGPGLVLEGADPNLGRDQAVANPLIGVMVRELHVSAAGRSAIRVANAREVTLRECRVRMRDTACLDPAVFALGDDLLIEYNVVEAPFSRIDTPTVSAVPTASFLPGSLSRGGIQIGGTSDRVRIVDNLIRGGSGNGITLGSLIFIDEQDKPVPPMRWPHPRPFDPCDPKLPASSIIVVVVFPTGEGQVRQASAGTLSKIVIERNRIYQMGMNGIGVAGFFDLSAADEFITVEGLAILGNDIRGCLRRPLEPIAEAMVDSLGYGGIALADVERLVIRDNVIEDNGPDYQEPICGLFVLHGEGMEISRNRIVNNGAKTGQPVRKFKPGRRGGIQIVYGIAPQSQVTRQIVEAQTFEFPYANGVPAVKIHDNIVSTPLGQALSLVALGPVSVIGNQFTTLDIVPGTDSPTFVAATVGILNLGLSNEMWFQLLGFQALRRGQVKSSAEFTRTPDAEGNISLAGLDDFRLGQYLANGNVLFTNNQCRLNLLERGFSVALTSVLILSLDDVGFHNNQCDADLLDDFILTQAFLFGTSLRVSDNRFKESLPTASYYATTVAVSRPTISALFSAITLGYLNMTTDNESTRCLLIRGGLVLNKHNIVLLDLLAGNTGNVEDIKESICGYSSRFIGNFGKGALVRG